MHEIISFIKSCIIFTNLDSYFRGLEKKAETKTTNLSEAKETFIRMYKLKNASFLIFFT